VNEFAVTWKEPPPAMSTRGKYQRTAGLTPREFVGVLKQNPGRWAQFRPGENLNSGLLASFKRFGCEAVTRGGTDGKTDIYVRWPA
jgi:hypothetical protein